MAKEANKTLIGLFVVGAVVLLVVALVVFGGGKFFKETSVLPKDINPILSSVDSALVKQSDKMFLRIFGCLPLEPMPDIDTPFFYVGFSVGSSF